MHIHAIITTFNAVENITNCLESLVGKVDDVYILDGRWLGVEGTSLHSIDGTIEGIVKFAQTNKLPVFLIMAKDLSNQVDSRNDLISLIPENDWFLVIDSDERIVRWENVQDTLDTAQSLGFRIRLCGTNVAFKGIPMPQPRLMKRTKDVHYTSNHRYMANVDKELKAGDDLPVIDVTIKHEGESKAMRKTMEKYADWLLKWEQIHADYLKDYGDWRKKDQIPTKQDIDEMTRTE